MVGTESWGSLVCGCCIFVVAVEVFTWLPWPCGWSSLSACLSSPLQEYGLCMCLIVQKLFCKLGCLFMRLADVMSRSTCVCGLCWLEEVEQCKPVSLYGGRGLLFILQLLSEMRCPWNSTTCRGCWLSALPLYFLTQSIHGSATSKQLLMQQRQLDPSERRNV